MIELDRSLTAETTFLTFTFYFRLNLLESWLEEIFPSINIHFLFFLLSPFYESRFMVLRPSPSRGKSSDVFRSSGNRWPNFTTPTRSLCYLPHHSGKVKSIRSELLPLTASFLCRSALELQSSDARKIETRFNITTFRMNWCLIREQKGCLGWLREIYISSEQRATQEMYSQELLFSAKQRSFLSFVCRLQLDSNVCFDSMIFTSHKTISERVVFTRVSLRHWEDCGLGR